MLLKSFSKKQTKGSYTRMILRKKPLSSHFGIEIDGIDLTKSSDEDLSNIKEMLIEHQLLLIRNQNFTLREYRDITKKLGTITLYPFSKGLPDFPEIVQIRKEPHQTQNFSELWHTDSTYLPAPPDFTLLHAEISPPIGGDTVFSNTVKAFEALSPKLKNIIETLECLCVSDLHSQDRTQHLATIKKSEALSAIHPAVRIHPRTARKAIYINEEHTHSFVGMTRDESKSIINYLTNFIKRSEFTLRVKWEIGTIAIWDNRTTQHHAVNDYHGHLRVMNRITLQDTV